MKKRTILISCLSVMVSTAAFSLTTESILSDASFGLFTNELDAAATIDEKTTGPGFTDLENDYLFSGISGNIEQLDGVATSGQFTIGYYRAADAPWSVFANINFSGSDTSNVLSQTDNGAGTTTEYVFPGYDVIFSDVSFLRDFDIVSAGLEFSMYLDSEIDPANNYTATTSATSTKVEAYNKNGNYRSLNFTLPVYYEDGDMRHYGELGFGFTNTDSSIGTETTVSGVKTEDSTTDIYKTKTPSLFYKLTIPKGMGEIISFIDASLTLPSATYEEFDNTGANEISADGSFDYKNGIDFTIGSAYQMAFEPTSGWLKFKLCPWLSYGYSSDAYKESSTDVEKTDGTVTSDQKTSGEKDSNIDHTINAVLDAAIEMKPDNWFIGFTLGSETTLGWNRNTKEEASGKITDNLTSTVIAESVDSESVNTYWTSTVDTNIGFFVPLPDDYRLDFSLNSQNFFAFENITLQLIVPLN